jgi:hypothetical protein
MEEHAKLAKECGVPKAMVPINGSAIRLAPDGPKLLSHEPAGRLVLDGDVILPADGATIVERRCMANYGLIAVSVVVGKNGLPAATPKVSTSEDGQRLRVTFTATRAEQLLLHVAMRSAISGTDGSEEVPLRGSPYTVDIVPGATLPRRCESYGEATHRARVRQPTSFILVARDAHGNRRTHGGDHFLVSFRGPCNPIGRVYDRGDGTYRVTCTYGVSGHCSLAITLHQQHVAGSPFRIIVDGPLRPPQAHPTHASMAPPTMAPPTMAPPTADNDQSGPQKRRAPPTAPGSTATAGGSGAAPRAVVVHDIRGRGAGGGSRPLSPRGAPVTVNSAVRVGFLSSPSVSPREH